MRLSKISDRLKEKCAVFGVYATSQVAARLSFYGLCALQHRGQESSGIASTDGKKLFVHADNGLVTSVYREEDLDKLPGYSAIGHNRYSTSGGHFKRFNQPFVNKKHGVALAHNGNLPDTNQLKTFLQSRKISTRYLNDSGMMLAAICEKLADGLTPEESIKACYPLFMGAFSCVFLTKDRLIAFRDPKGIRPFSLGRMVDGTYAVASETCALDTIGARLIRDIKPGEVLTIDSEGLHSIQAAKGTQKLDIFEFIYFARPDSRILGKSVNEIRLAFGRRLAAEHTIDADVVIPVPDSAIPAALGYSKVSGIPFEMSLIKNRYIHRTFIHPTAAMRTRDLTMKLNPIVESIRGRRVVLVDDSIVRGTTMRKVVAMLREAGATEVHLLISSPPVLFPDFYGINTPKQSELIAATRSIDDIRDYVGANSIHFLSYDGMVAATGLPESTFSLSCFSGEYPIDIGLRSAEVRPIDYRKYMEDHVQIRSVYTKKPRVAVFVSGNGTSVEYLIRDLIRYNLHFEIPLVICNSSDSPAVEKINNLNREFGLVTKLAVINSSTHPPKSGETTRDNKQTAAEEAAILEELHTSKIDLVVQLEYPKHMGRTIVKSFGWSDKLSSVYESRMVKMHYGLLPVTKGLSGVEAQARVLKNKLQHSGLSLHVVTDTYGEGPVVFEHHVPVQDDDSSESLLSRVQYLEKISLVHDIAQFLASQQQFQANKNGSN